jgi:hypothetical protein
VQYGHQGHGCRDEHVWPWRAFPGIPFRGEITGRPVFTPEDYSRYLQEPGGQVRKFGCRIHANRLITDYVHLVTTPERVESTGLMMNHLGQRYVQYIKRMYRRTGTSWENQNRGKTRVSANNRGNRDLTPVFP